VIPEPLKRTSHGFPKCANRFVHMHNTFRILSPKRDPDSILVNTQYSAKFVLLCHKIVMQMHNVSSTSSPRVGRAVTEAEEAKSPRAADGVASSAGRHSKKIRPCVQKTEHLSPILGSAATGNPTSKIVQKIVHVGLITVGRWTIGREFSSARVIQFFMLG